MSRKKSSHGKQSSAEYMVGRGRPPKEHRFPPGKSGNPTGRPKAVAKTIDDLFLGVVHRKLRIPSTGQLINVINGILIRLAEDALKGNQKSAALILNRYDRIIAKKYGSEVIEEEESGIIEAYIAERMKKLSKKGGEK